MAVIKDSPSRKLFKVCNYLFLLALSAACLVPILNMAAISLSDSLIVAANKIGLYPKGLNFAAYQHIAGNETFIRSFWNSIKVVILGVSFNMIITILGAYPMSRDDSFFKGRIVYVWFMIITILFGGGLLPMFMVVNYTGLMNTVWALIIPGGVGVFNIFMLMHFFRGIPKEVEESAFIDGAGYFNTMIRIHLPMALPAIATLVLFNFVGHWNEFFKGLIYLSDRAEYPLQTYLYTVLTEPDLTARSKEEIARFKNINSRTINAAQIFVAMIPVMVVYPFLQKYFTKGIVLGSVKG